MTGFSAPSPVIILTSSGTTHMPGASPVGHVRHKLHVKRCKRPWILFTAVGLPIATWRRCRALDGVPGLLAVHRSVGCTPDWEPVAALAEAALARAGDVVNNWLNAAAVLVWEQLSGEEPTCGRELRMSEVVLDAARAIEGLESVDALVRLQGQGGIPQSETLQRVRVVGLTAHLFGVSDGKSVLYRSPHDGYVLAFGAWPFPVDVRLGLAAVTYGGSLLEADTTSDARTGLLGCRCVDEPEFALWCATAPYVQHVDDELAGLNASSVHKVTFADLLLAGLTCANTEIRVLPLRWPAGDCRGQRGERLRIREFVPSLRACSCSLAAASRFRRCASSRKENLSAGPLASAAWSSPTFEGTIPTSSVTPNKLLSPPRPWRQRTVPGLLIPAAMLACARS